MDLLNLTNLMLDTTGSIEPRALAVAAAGFAIGLAALGGALAVGNAASHAFDAGARQPEIFSKIQTLLLISIVFIESLVIYSLVVSLILIFTVN
ncbi:MAG: ATP synthase F0 subunit C [Clostridiales bacterium]|nr:ATP synthase F0 subunit C [Clostridiales bacterium]MBR3533588.1 ATP synthase F0 subunit C [Clostridiales bacterium]